MTIIRTTRLGPTGMPPTDVGFDPIPWVYRLMVVSEESQFTEAQKGIILRHFLQLLRELHKQE